MYPTNTILENISDEEYSKIDAINYSSLKKFMVSPKHYKYSTEDQALDTKEAFNVGRAIHHLALKKETFSDNWVVSPVCDKRTKDGKQIWEDFVKSSAGKSILLPDEFETVTNCGAALLNNDYFKYFFGNGKVSTECVIVTEYAGVKIKGRLDAFNVTTNTVMDIKSFNKTPEVEEVVREIFNRRYNYQAFLYKILGKSVTGSLPKFEWCFIEKKSPNSIGWFEYSDRLVSDQSVQNIEEALCRFENAKKNDIWTGLPHENTPYVL